MTAFKYIFGPVPSRRLGRSLGVDLIPFKTCSYDCLYCQLGPTTNKTVQRLNYLPSDEIIRDVERKIGQGVQADYITLSGSGEPTLHADCGRIIRRIKDITEIPVAVLTNGSLLSDPEVRHDLSMADLVVPSLDAGTPQGFATVNQPHPSIDFQGMVKGLLDFCQEHKGQIWLEVFILKGITDSEDQLAGIADIVSQAKPHKVQLNTVARPPASAKAKAVTREELEQLAERFSPIAEIAADFTGVHAQPDAKVRQEDILNLLDRRPCTLEDISASLGLHPNESLKHLNHLLEDGRIRLDQVGESRFYVRNDE
jgi:wyosine [tRNA(Phe)-imidazoG37] synthetase (radical SAM superfamily)